jgi:hypothetical protein
MKDTTEVLEKFEEILKGRRDALEFLRDFESNPAQMEKSIVDFEAPDVKSTLYGDSYLTTLKNALKLSQSEPLIKFSSESKVPPQDVKWMSKFPVSVIRLFYELGGSEKAFQFARENHGSLGMLEDKIKEVELEIAEFLNENSPAWMKPTASPRMVKDGYLRTLKEIVQDLIG